MSVLKKISKLKKTAKYLKAQKQYLKIQKEIREIEREKKEEEYFSKNEKKNIIFHQEALKKQIRIGTKKFKRKYPCTKMKDKDYQLYFSK